MSRHRFTSVLLAALLASCATHKDAILEPWLGAPEAELVSKWGYPQEANDVVRINDEVIIYTFRSRRRGPGGPTDCVVSFTIKSGVVSGYRVEGGNCPRIARFD